MPIPNRDRQENVPQMRGPACPDVSIVIPVFGSQDCLNPLVNSITRTLQAAGYRHEIILVNDASTDGSWNIISSLAARYRSVVGVDLRRNFGQDNAILAGI